MIVRKMAGQNVYKGSNANGVRSLSLPKWRESFVVSGINDQVNYVKHSSVLCVLCSPTNSWLCCVSVGKPKKGVIYPSTLDYVPSRPTYVKTSEGGAYSYTPIKHFCSRTYVKKSFKLKGNCCLDSISFTRFYPDVRKSEGLKTKPQKLHSQFEPRARDIF